MLDYPDLYASFTRPQLDQLDRCKIFTQSGCNQILVSYYSSRSRMIVFRSGTYRVIKFNPTTLDRYTNASQSTRSSTRPIHNCFSIASLALLHRLATRSLYNFYWHVKNIRVGSPSDADQGRHSWPLPITHTDWARPVPICLIRLD